MVKHDMDKIWETLLRAETDADKEALRAELVGGGYPVFYRLLESYRQRINSFGDGEAEEVLALIDKGRELVPDPSKISPAWADVWAKLEQMVQYKQRALDAVPADKRDGEWQVLIDNPFENRETACYPGLTFMEAVFIYAKFRPELMNNEFVRLQKVDTHLTEFGADE